MRQLVSRILVDSSTDHTHARILRKTHTRTDFSQKVTPSLAHAGHTDSLVRTWSINADYVTPEYRILIPLLQIIIWGCENASISKITIDHLILGGFKGWDS